MKRKYCDFFEYGKKEIVVRKIISGVLSCVFLFFAIVGFASCNHEKNIAYNAIPIGGRLKETFLNKEENRIKIAYKNENYNGDFIERSKL